LDGDAELKSALEKLGLNLVQLVAETALWASPVLFRLLIEENGNGTWYPNTRRFRANRGEAAGQGIDGVYLDKNNYPNAAIKRAIGLDRLAENYIACHIWPDSCYDDKYHTCIANLILLPRAIAGLSDHDELTQLCIRYRSYEIYQWYPAEQRMPTKPQGYPDNWRSVFPFNDTVKMYLRNRRRT
jgi:hypothetical protein